MQETVCYEHPLNERIRVLLRLEFLFQQITLNASRESCWNSRIALQGLFEILKLTGRNELKAELIKELERHSASLNRLRQLPGVDPEMLNTILNEISHIAQRLQGVNNLALEDLRQNDLLNAIRQRSLVPGGTVPFDLPAFHYWLQRDNGLRRQHLQTWSAAFQPMREAVELILRLTRETALPRREIAEHGFFQKSLDGGVPNQLLRIFVPLETQAFPEISGGKQRFAIHFMEQPDPNKRASQIRRDIEFHLVCCAI